MISYRFLRAPRRRAIRGILVFVSVTYFTFCFVSYRSLHNTSKRIVDLSKNYFQSEDVLMSKMPLVDTSDKCRIPDIDLWNDDVQPFLKKFPPYACNKKLPNLTYIMNDEVIINSEVLKDMGYNLESTSCCYHTIQRVEQSEKFHTLDADNQYRFSENCKQMSKSSSPGSSFIKVVCKHNGWFFNSIIYENFHAIADLTSQSLREKLRFWENCRKIQNNGVEERDLLLSNQDNYLCRNIANRPPNVLVFGIDSTSRINFRRFLKKTVKILENLEAVEMLGYTKVGENTLPNLIPMLTSFSMDEIQKTCFTTDLDPFDDCPFIWKEFSKQKYLTGHMEDSPRMAIFNYMKTGFVKQPVDIYLRPLMLALYQKKGNFPFAIDCAGYQRPEEFILQYISDIVAAAKDNNIPFFITSWLTDLTHDNMNKLELYDETLSKSLLYLRNQGLLDNTVVFLASDHGYRFLPVRKTLSGWYEDKLPAMWIHLPKKLKDNNPEWQDSLLHNSRQLTSPYDIHATLQNILRVNEGSTTPSHDNGRGISLFSKLSQRNCKDAGIPQDCCACEFPIKYENEKILQAAGEAVVNHLNSKLPPECLPLKLSSVVTSGIITSGRSMDTSVIQPLQDLKPRDSLIIGLITSPGSFMFEARIEYDKTSFTFTNVSSVLRTNKVKIYVLCLKEESPAIELICFCRQWDSFWWPKLTDE